MLLMCFFFFSFHTHNELRSTTLTTSPLCSIFPSINNLPIALASPLPFIFICLLVRCGLLCDNRFLQSGVSIQVGIVGAAHSLQLTGQCTTSYWCGLNRCWRNEYKHLVKCTFAFVRESVLVQVPTLTTKNGKSCKSEEEIKIQKKGIRLKLFHDFVERRVGRYSNCGGFFALFIDCMCCLYFAFLFLHNRHIKHWEKYNCVELA